MHDAPRGLPVERNLVEEYINILGFPREVQRPNGFA